MLKKVIRVAGITCSVLFLTASIAIIFWISQNEQQRLALKERAGFTRSQGDASTGVEDKAKAEAAANIEAADKTLNDIDTLLSSISTDDLPSED